MYKIINNTCLVLFVAIFIATMFSFVNINTTVSAQSNSASWIDNWNLEYGGNTYTSDDMNQTWKFYRVGDPDGCLDFIEDIDWDPSIKDMDKIDDPSDDDTTAKYVSVAPSASGGCLEASPINIDLTSPQNAMTSFIWDGEVITTTNTDNPISFSFDQANLNLYVRDGDNNCKDTIVVGTNKASGEIIIRTTEKGRFTRGPFAGDGEKTNDLWSAYDGGAGGDSGHAWISQADYDKVENGCFVSQVAQVNIGNVADYRDPGQGTVSGNTVGVSSSAGSTCESEGGTFSWVLCPVLEWSSKALETVEGWITNKLEIPDGYYDNEGVKGAWSNIRNIAYIILIPVMLLMVISTALGFSVFDAYTVKRALPRLFAAIIFMALSYEFTTLLVEITNIVGQGVAGLIAAPFGGSDALSLQAIFNPNSVDSGLIVGGGGIVLAGLAVGAIAVVSIGVLASYLFVAALALLSIFFLLIFRQIIIVALIIAAPLAILSWIFPGNDKLWKIWWQSFSKLLMLYPIVVAAIVTGRAFASIVSTSETAGVDTVLSVLVTLTAYIAPFFLIPTLFRYAGGAFANLAGIVNNRSKGLFDRQRNYRGNKKKENWASTKSGNRFSERNAISRRFNRMGAGAGAGYKGRFGIGERGNQATDIGGQIAADEALKNNPRLQKLAFNDDGNAVMALAGGSRAGAEQAARELFTDANGNYDEDRGRRAIEAAASVGFTRSNSQAALTTLAQNKARSVAAGAAGRQHIQNGINRLSGNNTAMAENLRDSFAYNSSNAGRGDLGGTDWNSVSAPTVATNPEVSTASLDGFGRGSLYAAGSGYAKAVTGATDDVVNLLSRGENKDQMAAAIHYKELDSLRNSGANAGVRDEATKQMLRLEAAGVNKTLMSQPSGRIDPATGAQREVTVTERFDGARALADPAYDATWTGADRVNGQRTFSRPETISEAAGQEARSYEQPNPSTL